MRVAIFGGAFDPIHDAHVAVARAAVREFSLDRLQLTPAANPPHKKVHAPYENRYRMVELAIEREPALEASRLEAGTTCSYSIDTIERLRRELKPDDILFFLIGSDAFAEIRTWKRWRDVVRSVEFIVAGRPGSRYEIPEGARVHRLDTVALEVSSSEIRRKLAGKCDEAGIPPAVLRYIRERGLYTAAVLLVSCLLLLAPS
ncbi:MAG: nicotinate (nicotinamide) nucleotide adenylyltransferase [Bryobacteraceae bacterium]